MTRGVLFDLDGTLLDTLADLADAVNHVLERFGYPVRSMDEIRRFVGNGVERLIALSVPKGVAYEAVLKEFRTYYQAHCREKTGPYEGILDALREIGQLCPVAIVSNKPDAAVKALCAEYFPGVYALGESADCPRKPATDMVFKAMQAIGVERCVYVGDSEVDVATAKNAGVTCLSVLWGFRNRAELEQAGAEHFCAQPAGLYGQIKDLLRLDGQ